MKCIYIFCTPIILLLAHPRSLSTAFERIIRERGDFTVIHEPFTYLYYLKHFPDSPETTSFPDYFPKTYAKMCEWILSHDTPVFIKDMAFALDDLSILDHVKLMLLHRDPSQALPSLYKMEPECDFEFTGFAQLSNLIPKAQFILDAEELQNNPEKSYLAFCKTMGIPHLPDALHFQKRTPSECWQGKWYKEVRLLDRITKRARHKMEDIPLKDRPRWMRYYCDSMPHYEELVRATPRINHID